MQIAMLGPLEVRDDDGAAVPVAGIRLRTLLIALALTPRQLIPTSRLIDAVWGDGPPPGAANALQALVSRLRRALPAGSIESHPAGYRLVTGSDDVDIVRFERLVAAGRAELARDPAPAAETLRDALGLWRGPALLDVFDQEFFQTTITRLDELRLTAIEDRVGAELRLGRGADLVTELTALAVEHPLRERLVAALMRAMSEAGSPAEALGLFALARLSPTGWAPIRPRSCPPCTLRCSAVRSHRHRHRHPVRRRHNAPTCPPGLPASSVATRMSSKCGSCSATID